MRTATANHSIKHINTADEQFLLTIITREQADREGQLTDEEWSDLVNLNEAAFRQELLASVREFVARTVTNRDN